MPEKKGRFLLVYGSQTGQAEAIAEEMFETALSYNLHPELHCLSKTDKKFNIEREKYVVIVVSTTGEGDPPDTALKFWRRIKKKTLPTDLLSDVKYAILGLGDSNYTNFCNCCRIFDERLQELGAKHFYATGYGDDAVGLEVVVEPWMDGLWPVLQKELGVSDLDEETSYNNAVSEPPLINENADTNEPKTAENSHNHDTEDRENLVEKVENGISDLEIGESVTISNGYRESVLITNGVSDSVDGDQTVNKNQLQTQVSVQKEPVESELTSTPPLERSLTSSIPPLSEANLSLPVVSPPFIEINFSNEKWDSSQSSIQNGAKLPSAASSVALVAVTKATVLTSVDAVKKTLELELEAPDYQYEPGDSVSIVCENEPSEVQRLLQRLNVADVADKKCILSVMAETKKKRAVIHDYIPTEATLRHIFTSCCDIRTTLKKACLRMLVDYTTDPTEKRRLQELTSKQGSEDYAKFVRETHVSLLDILLSFPSCNPPVERLIEQLPRLQPRPYSACSSPLEIPGRIRIAFNVLEMEAGSGRHSDRTGVCTGWLNRITEKMTTNPTSTSENGFSGDDTMQVPMYFRTNQHFRLPTDPSVDLVMIGPGTGVAPFVGMIKHRHAQKQAGHDIGKMWLFYGCRHEACDYIYREDLEKLRACGSLTELSVSFSRDDRSPEQPRYVQDSMRIRGKQLYEWIQGGAHVYVCGDANHMAKDVNEAWADIISECKGVTIDVAKARLMSLRLNHRYLEDVWS
ncbi:methionine synthase reductase-like [Tubulanus polymorphus]|uniref:methionine synthase reductase-like n=1 Tax=Tubulanus polymorphus TaxID=672921 RepID=UPI003DA63962